MPLKAQGEFALVRQRIQAAAERSGQPVKRGTMAHDHELKMVLVDSAAQLRDADALREFTPRLEELAQRDNHRLYLPIASRARGIAHLLAGEYADAQDRLVRALELFSALGTRWQLGRTLMALGDLEDARGATGPARDYYARALEEFHALGAAPDAARAQAVLAHIG